MTVLLSALLMILLIGVLDEPERAGYVLGRIRMGMTATSRAEIETLRAARRAEERARRHGVTRIVLTLAVIGAVLGALWLQVRDAPDPLTPSAIPAQAPDGPTTRAA